MTSETRLRIMVVEDHPVVRSAIAETLDVPGLEVVATYPSAEALLEALALPEAPDADVVLVDIGLPGMSGIDLVRELSTRMPRAHLVMLTASAADEDLIASVQGGAVGYLTKDLPPDALVRSLRGLRDGELPMTRRLAARLVEHVAGRDWERGRPVGHGDLGLSDRELQVLLLIDEARTDRQIADALGISDRTVGRHVGNILSKLGVHSRAEAARRYRESG